MAKNKIKYKDFEAFVRNRPVPDTPGFYKLWRLKCEDKGYECHEVEGLSLNYRIPYKGKQWRFEILPWRHMEFEYYPTFEEAHTAMMEDWGEDEEIYFKNTKLNYTFGYQISRLGFGPHGTRDFYVEYWKYDHNKKEYDRSSCSSYHWNLPGVYGKFLGRLPEQIRFRKGDLVEISRSSHEEKGMVFSVLGVVIGQPRTVKDEWGYLKSSINKLAEKGVPIEKAFEEPDQWGVDNEEYFVLFGPYEESMLHAEFIHPQEVRPPSFPVPKEARETMKQYYKDYLESLKNG